ncbi:ABC transporter permease [Paenibacillus sp. MSJ-34]|uniref:ABC transporter permease n=1 Tax=Paenibacillus sp. MSJ-34 TaxID=2841529 RepID=UPI001C10CB60|nr:ABC transporter permease [Paenibacillus sp. MSJ-34]MBU5441055.1 ABC transporter permease [Paenibacillus sp. MSJ-34]
MNKLGTIIGFTFKNKVKTKAFLVTTIVLILLMTIGINIPFIISLFDGDQNKTAAIGVVADGKTEVAAMLKDYYDKQENPDLQIRLYDQEASAQADETKLKQEVANKVIKGYLVPQENVQIGFPDFVYKSEGMIDMNVSSSLQNALRTIKMEVIVKDSLTEAQKEALNAPIQIESEQIATEPGENPAKTGEQAAIGYIMVTVLMVLFFMTIMMTGNMIASEVTAEKSSRIMEILITSTSPLQQMFGKVIGMFLVGLVQIVVFAITIAVNLSLPHNAAVFADIGLDLSQIDPAMIIYGFIFYVLGYFLYATLFAAIGSLVSRTEELGQAVMPITVLSLAAFYISTFSVSTPNTILVKVSSFIPFFSPTSMILRIGVGHVAAWEIWLSIAILAVSIYVFGWLSAKIYRTGVLMYGKRPTFKELRKAMKAYKI